ncbi:MAG TPA: hypothetical protein VEC18_08550 [Myxococcota bacterium]|nr:hypothetical protein [Myxococcota bacterium]
MADLKLAEPPRRAQLIEQIRVRIGEVVPAFQLIAENVLGADASIDLVGVEPTGRAVLVLVGAEGDDLELIARAVAQRAWLEPRIRDWIQLAPNIGLRPGAGARSVLVCPSFRRESEAAAAALGEPVVSLVRYRCLSNGSSLEVLLEPAGEVPAGRALPRGEPTALPRFRTGLSREDLGLSAEEYRAFE